MRRLLPPAARDVALAAFAALALCAPAQAATVRAQTDECSAVVSCVAELEVSAGPGERNDLTLTVDGDGFVVRDDGAPLVADRNCVPREDGTVRCALPRPFEQVIVEAGDGDDVVRTPASGANTFTFLGEGDDRYVGGGALVDVGGGPGNDDITATGDTKARLRGAGGDDVLVSGAAADDLGGGEGRDRLSAGPGDDVLDGREFDEPAIAIEVPTADVADGGPGRDAVNYRYRRADMTIDLLDPAPDGAAGEGDVLTGIEDVIGGDGDDAIRGDHGPNLIRGGGGIDVLNGYDGPDELRTEGLLRRFAPLGDQPEERPERAAGDAGDDVVVASGFAFLSGGPGDDRFLTGRGRAARATCGPGADEVRVSRRTVAPIMRSCERWSFRVLRVRGGFVRATFPHPRLRAGAVRLAVPCSRRATSRCSVVLRVRTVGGRALAGVRATARAGQRRTLVARIPARARRRFLEARVVVLIRRPGTRPVRAGVRATL